MICSPYDLELDGGLGGSHVCGGTGRRFSLLDIDDLAAGFKNSPGIRPTAEEHVQRAQTRNELRGHLSIHRMLELLPEPVNLNEAPLRGIY